jgi:hypothetical protein
MICLSMKLLSDPYFTYFPDPYFLGMERESWSIHVFNGQSRV